MMEEAVEVFEQQGAKNDAAMAKSNLGNLYYALEWLTVEERLRRATSLYDSAVESAEEPEFRALLKDNIASHLGNMANFGLAGARRKALEMSIAAAQDLEASGKTARLPELLLSVVLHLADLREETDTPREDLQRARDVGKRALALVEGPRGNAVDKPVRTQIFRSVAKILVQSVAYEPEHRSNFASEAIRLMDLTAGDPDDRKIDSDYTRARALEMLDDAAGALQHVDVALMAVKSGHENPEFTAGLLRLRYTLLSKLRSGGDVARIDAAERLAEYAQQEALLKDWVFGEGALLEERLFAFASALAAAGTIDELHIERAERVLAQVGSDSEDALTLQATLANAYSFRAATFSDEDDLVASVALFNEIGSSLRLIDRFVVISKTFWSAGLVSP